MPTSQRQLSGRYGGLKSWANTADRSARTEPTRRASPGSLDYWLARQDRERFADATDGQRIAAADSARKAYFAKLAMRSAQIRRERVEAARLAQRVERTTSSRGETPT